MNTLNVHQFCYVCFFFLCSTMFFFQLCLFGIILIFLSIVITYMYKNVLLIFELFYSVSNRYCDILQSSHFIVFIKSHMLKCVWYSSVLNFPFPTCQDLVQEMTKYIQQVGVIDQKSSQKYQQQHCDHLHDIGGVQFTDPSTRPCISFRLVVMVSSRSDTKRNSLKSNYCKEKLYIIHSNVYCSISKIQKIPCP